MLLVTGLQGALPGEQEPPAQWLPTTLAFNGENGQVLEIDLTHHPACRLPPLENSCVHDVVCFTKSE